MKRGLGNPPLYAHCTKPSELAIGSEIYPHRPDLAALKFWRCEPCKAWCGVHRDSKRFAPLGSPANAELRQMRMHCHSLFDPTWRAGEQSRNAAYAWLATELGIEVAHCHIGHFRFDRARQAIEILERRLRMRTAA